MLIVLIYGVGIGKSLFYIISAHELNKRGWLPRHEEAEENRHKENKQFGSLKAPFPANLKQRDIPSMLSKVDLLGDMVIRSLLISEIR